MCDCHFSNSQCKDAPRPGSKFCILHTEFPDKSSPQYAILKDLKTKKIKEKIQNGDFNFEGAIFDDFTLPPGNYSEANFRYAEFRQDATFNSVNFLGDTTFCRAKFGGKANFWNAKFEKSVMFYNSEFVGLANFSETRFCGPTNFMDVKFGGEAWFNNSRFVLAAIFSDTKFEKEARFSYAKFKGITSFIGAKFNDCSIFNQAKFCNPTSFERAEFLGRGSFYDTTFMDFTSFDGAEFARSLAFSCDFQKKVAIPQAREQIYRLLKKYNEKLGKKDEADEYHYLEMVAKRQQKTLIFRTLELPLEFPFYYGVKPWRTFGVWLLAILMFALIYCYFHFLTIPGVLDSIWFSFTNSMRLVYNDNSPLPGFPQVVANIEALFGTFMWAAFIAIFVRKCGR